MRVYITSDNSLVGDFDLTLISPVDRLLGRERYFMPALDYKIYLESNLTSVSHVPCIGQRYLTKYMESNNYPTLWSLE